MAAKVNCRADRQTNAAALKGTYSAPIDLLGVPGRTIRHFFMSTILSGTPILCFIQKWRSPWLDTTMHVLSFLGTEDFYTPILMVLAWGVELRFARLFFLLMSMCFYCATFLKNSLRLPRPANPPVTVLEVTHDWAFPSLHSLVGTCLPIYLYYYTTELIGVPPQWKSYLLLLVSFWSISVMISRMYLGVHSLSDIISGSAIGFGLFYWYSSVHLTLDAFLCTSSGVMTTFIVYVGLLSIHPSSGPPTSSYGETVILAGCAFGFLVGSMRAQASDTPELFRAVVEANNHSSRLASFLTFLARFLLGATVSLSTKKLLKFVVPLLCCPMVLIVNRMGKHTLTPFWARAYKLVGWNPYSYKQYSKEAQRLSKHYTTEFRIPEIWQKPCEAVSNGHCIGRRSSDETEQLAGITFISDNQYDVDIPTKFITYSGMCWFTSEFAFLMFHYLNL